MADKPRGRTVRCAVCKTRLGVERVTEDRGLFRMVKTEYTAPHFLYVVDYGYVSERCIPCAAPGYSPEFKARMEGYAAREREMIAKRRAEKIARGQKVGTFDPGQSYLDDIAQIAASYQKALSGVHHIGD